MTLHTIIICRVMALFGVPEDGLRRLTVASAEHAEFLALQPPKKPTIPFNITLTKNPGSNPAYPIDPSEVSPVYRDRVPYGMVVV